MIQGDKSDEERDDLQSKRSGLVEVEGEKKWWPEAPEEVRWSPRERRRKRLEVRVLVKRGKRKMK